MDRIKLVFLSAFIISSLTLGIFFMLSCNTFKPIWIKELPPECNMSLNMASLYYKAGDKSGVVPASTACLYAIKELKCSAEAYGLDKEGQPNLVDQADQTKYTRFLNCMARR